METENIFFLGVIFLLGIAVRLPYLNFPIDEDMGFYFYLAHFRSRGIRMVKDYWGFIFPLLLCIKIIMHKISGGEIKKVRFYFALYNVFTIASVYKLTEHLHSSSAGLCAALFFAIFSAAPHLGSYSANCEKYYMLPLTLSLLLTLIGIESGNLPLVFIAGALSGFAFLIKIVLILTAAAFTLYLFIYGNFIFSILWLAGFLISILLHFAILYAIYRNELPLLRKQYKARFIACMNIIGSFLDITERFAIDFVPLLKETFFLWAGALPYIYISITNREPYQVLLLLWLVSLVATWAGQKSLWQYTYQPLILIFSVLSALSVESLYQMSQQKEGFAILTLTILFVSFIYSLTNLFPFYLFKNKKIFFLNSFRKSDQYLFMPVIGKYIKENTNEDDRIFIWGAGSSLHLLSERESCEKSIFHFIRPFNKEIEFQYDETIKGIMKYKPKFIIQVFSSFNIEQLNRITGLTYVVDRVFFNRYIVFKLMERQTSIPLYDELETWDQKKAKLDALSRGIREGAIFDYYLKSGQPEKYLFEFEEALKINPYYVEALTYSGIYYRSVKDYSRSLRYLKRGVTGGKLKAWVYYEQALTYKDMKDIDNMKIFLNKARKSLIPFSAHNMKLLGVIHRLLGHHSKSINYFRLLLKIHGPFEWLYYEMAILYRDSGDYDKSIRYFNKEVTLFPEGEWKYFEMGMTYVKMEDHEKALQYFEKELEGHPNATVHYAMASLLKTKRNFDKALKHFNTIVHERKYPEELIGGGYYHMGSIYLIKNKINEAVDAFKECLKHIPGHKQAAAELKSIECEP